MASSALNPRPMMSTSASRQPDILPTLFGAGYGTYQVQPRNYLFSFLAHVAIISALLAFVILVPQSKPVQQVVGLVTDISPYILSPGAASGGGGGGGDHDKLNAPKGAPPKSARDQFTPPQVVIRNQDPKLAITPTVVAPDVHIAPATTGDPLAAL